MPTPQMVVERYQSLILTPRGLSCEADGLPSPCQEPQCRGATVSGTSSEQGSLKATLCVLPSLKDTVRPLVEASAGSVIENCPNCAILAVGGWCADARKACLGHEWLWEASPGYSMSLSRVSRSTLVYVPQVASVIHGSRGLYLLAL